MIPKPNCLDCNKPYSEFGLDTVLSDEQWLLIHPDRDGLLCANCIVKRAAKLETSIIVKLFIEFGGTLVPLKSLDK